MDIQSYRRVFEQYASILQEKYPDLTVSGDTYPPPFLRMSFAHFLNVFKLVFIALILGGITPFPSLGMTTPQFYVWMTENKMHACLMIYFLSNALESQLVSTGAFEIALNGKLF
ncbi:thioredoxin reductase-like selenoprotein T [Centruroides sculpturatus]|uniref:thioredoxin reductase-like selenoprotein T n=1 Tax=Centruroides sculpturatus TaxID=218467 RepID=UPI000C6E1D71|nr:thioredoxin reductase-like selenoprotein T [Centruroides sculpturatus]